MSRWGEDSRIGVQENVSECGTGRRFDFKYAGPAGRIVGGPEFGEPIAIAGAASEDEFAVGGEFEEGAVGKVGAGAVDLEG